MQKTKKYSKKEFLLFGVNFVVGYGFIVGLSSAYGGLGLFYIVALVVCGIIAFAVGINYAQIAKKFSSSYGSGYVISRKAFGKAGGFFNGWIQYIQSPILAVSAVAGIIWSFQNLTIFGITFDEDWLKTHGWIIALFAALMFWGLSIILSLGFSSTRFMLIFFSILKWAFIVLCMGVALYLCIKLISTDSSTFAQHITDYIFPQNPSFPKIIISTTTIFVSFAGLEGLAMMSGDVEDSKRTVPKALKWTIVITIGFYTIFFLLMLGSLGGFGDNGILPGSIDKHSNKTNAPNPGTSLINAAMGAVVGTAFNVFLIVTQISNKCTNRLQSGWIFSRNLISLSANGSLPKYFVNVSRKGQFKRCVWLDFFIGFIFVTAYVVSIVFSPGISSKLDDALSGISLQLFLLYSLTSLSTIKLYFKKQIALTKKTLSIIIFAFISVSFLFLSYVISELIDFIQTKNISDLLAIFMIFIGVLIGVIIYFTSKLKKWDEAPNPPSFAKFLQSNPQLHISYEDFN